MKKFLSLIAGLCVLCASAGHVQAQVTPTTIAIVSNMPANMPASTTSNIFVFTGTNQPFSTNIVNLRQGAGLGRQYVFAGQFPGTTANLIANWVFSMDGTNWTTVINSGTISDTNAGTSTNVTVTFVNTSSQTLNNALYGTLGTVQNTGTNALTNITAATGLGNVLPGAYQ